MTFCGGHELPVFEVCQGLFTAFHPAKLRCFQSHCRKNFRSSKSAHSTAFCHSSACKLCCKSKVLENLSIKWCQTLFPVKTNFWGIQWKGFCKSKLETKSRDNPVPPGFTPPFPKAFAENDEKCEKQHRSSHSEPEQQSILPSAFPSAVVNTSPF